MTVSSQVTKVTATGSASAFTYSFSPLVIFAATDLVVTSTVIATGVETTLAQGTGATNYSVGISTYPATGSITYPADEGTAIGTAVRITIKRTLTLEQQTDLNNQGGYFADTQEAQFDKLVMLDLQQQEVLDRSFTFPVSYTGSASTTIPAPVAATPLAWNAAGTALENTTASTLQTSSATLTALASYNTNGLITQTSANTFTGRTLTGTADEITVTNGDGVSGNPTLSIPDAVTLVTPTVTGVTTFGGNIKSDTDSTDDIGTTGVRWRKLWVDSIQTTDNLDVAGNLVVTGNLTINGTTVTNDATNTEIKDPLIELNSGAGSNANDLGLIFERGSTGNNGAFLWDESADKFAFGTTEATGSSTGNITYADAQVLAEGATFSGTSPDLGTVTTIDINGGTIDATNIGASTAGTGAFSTITAATSLALATGSTVTGILDEDAMGTNSATQLATQQSIKAYVDSNLTAAGIQMTWETATTDTDQGVGKVFANNATLSSATVLYFDDVENNGVSINSFIDSLDDPTATNSATIYISEGGTGGAGVVFQVSGAVTSASTYSKVAVTHVATYGTLADGDLIGVVIAFSGNNGSINNIVEDTSPSLGGDLDANGHQVQWSKGADVASNGALAVGTDGNYFDVTGTTTITSINSTGGAGTLIKLHFDGACQLTHHASNLILAGAENFTTEAGDELEFVEYGSGTYRQTGWCLAGTAPGGGGGGSFLGEGASGESVGTSGDIIRVNEATLNTSQTMAATDNGSATGPISIASGVTLTISSGATFVVI